MAKSHFPIVSNIYILVIVLLFVTFLGHFVIDASIGSFDPLKTGQNINLEIYPDLVKGLTGQSILHSAFFLLAAINIVYIFILFGKEIQTALLFAVWHPKSLYRPPIYT